MAKKRKSFSISELASEAEIMVNRSRNLNAQVCALSRLRKLKSALDSVPQVLPDAIKNNLMKELFDISKDDLRGTESLNFDAFADDGDDRPVVVGPPVGTCKRCNSELTLRTRCDARLVTLNGIAKAVKLSLRCGSCMITYQYSKYGNTSDGFRFYEFSRDFVEASDVILISKKVCELQACLANHAWVSFEGFATAMNESLLADSVGPDIDRRILSNGFYWYEIENELRRIHKIEFRFSGTGSAFSDAFPVIEEIRLKTVYHHTCTEVCIQKGCGKMIVVDGLWKLNFTHCMMVSKNIIRDVPLLNLPDVCTCEPEAGHAFCKEHCSLIEEFNKTKTDEMKVPTKLRDFLRFCGVYLKEGTDEPSEDAPSIHAKVMETVTKVGVNCTAGDNVINSHAGQEAIGENVHVLQSILEDSCGADNICSKETGEKRPLHQRSRGHMAAVSPGGHILMFNPLYRSESPSQAFLFILVVLCNALKGLPRSIIHGVWVVYDNMCNILRLKASSKLASSGGVFGEMWSSTKKMIDGLHIKNHKQKFCQETLHPSRFDEMYPELKGQRNTMVAEQTFVWFGRYKKIVSSMPKSRHMFYLHRMVLRRNSYTSSCHRKGVNVVLPKVRNLFTS